MDALSSNSAIVGNASTAQLGTVIGLRYRIEGAPRGARVLVDVVVPAAMAVPPMVMQAAVVRVRASRWARDGIGALRISVKNLTLVVAPAAPW